MSSESLQDKRRAIREAVLNAIKKRETVVIRGTIAEPREMSVAELFEEEKGPAIVGWTVPDIFHLNQGVTWGGRNCESIYRVDEQKAQELEPEMIKKSIGGREIYAGGIIWSRSYLVFPYVESANRWVRAFSTPKLGGDDALNGLSKNADPTDHKARIMSELNVRIANGLITYPRTAKYLVQFYDTLSKREFKGRSLSQYHKSWYEYIWPRSPLLIRKPKIVCRRLMKSPAFALDNQGFLPTDSVITLIPRERFVELKETLRGAINEPVDDEQALLYVLVWLNSGYFKSILEKKRAKKRGGYPMVDERMLGRFTIPKPMAKIAEHVRAILTGKAKEVDLKAILSASKRKRLASEQTKLSQ